MAGYSPYARYEAPYSTMPTALMRVLVRKGVGRNGWAVMASLCCGAPQGHFVARYARSGVHEDSTIDRRSAASVCEMTGLTRNQVARGMAELREKGVIVPVMRTNTAGYAHPDRSNFGHVVQYRFTIESWGQIRAARPKGDALLDA